MIRYIVITAGNHEGLPEFHMLRDEGPYTGTADKHPLNMCRLPSLEGLTDVSEVLHL